MANDVYSRQRTEFKGSFASDMASMSLAGTGTPLGIVQSMTLTFGQQIARIYDVSNGGSGGQAGGKVPIFYVGGRTQGQATIARILGPSSGTLTAFYKELGNVCSPQDLAFTFRAGCGAQEGTRATKLAETVGESQFFGNGQYNSTKYTLIASVMTNLQVNVASTDMLVNESVTLMFANLECEDGAGS